MNDAEMAGRKESLPTEKNLCGLWMAEWNVGMTLFIHLEKREKCGRH